MCPSKAFFRSRPRPPAGKSSTDDIRAKSRPRFPGEAVTSIELAVSADRFGQGSRDLRPWRRAAPRRLRPPFGLRRHSPGWDTRERHHSDADEPLVVCPHRGHNRQPPPSRPGRRIRPPGHHRSGPAPSEHDRAQAEAAAHRVRGPGLPCRQRLVVLRQIKVDLRYSASGGPASRLSACPSPSSLRRQKRPRACTMNRSTMLAGRPRWVRPSMRASRQRAFRCTASGMIRRKRRA